MTHSDFDTTRAKEQASDLFARVKASPRARSAGAWLASGFTDLPTALRTIRDSTVVVTLVGIVTALTAAAVSIGSFIATIASHLPGM